MIIAKSEGFEIGNFRIPPFELNKGELISICLFGGGHFFDLEMELVKHFTGVNIHSKLTMNQNLEFVEHIKTNGLRNSVFPLTVGKYLVKNGLATTEELKKAFGLDYISSKTKIKNLAGNPRKWLSLISTLSKTDKIVFDLVGQDPLGAEKTVEFIKKYTDKGGAAILLDNFEDLEPKCVKNLKVEIIK